MGEVIVGSARTRTGARGLAKGPLRPPQIARAITAIAQSHHGAETPRPPGQGRFVGTGGGEEPPGTLQAQNGLEKTAFFSRCRKPLGRHHHPGPESSPRPGPLEQIHRQAFSGLPPRMKDDFAARQVVADRHGEMPPGIPGKPEVLKDDDRMTGGKFAEEVLQGGDGVGDPALAPGSGDDLRLEGSLTARREDAGRQLVHADRNPAPGESHGERGRPAVIRFLGIERDFEKFHFRRKRVGRIRQQTICLRRGATREKHGRKNTKDAKPLHQKIETVCH